MGKRRNSKKQANLIVQGGIMAVAFLLSGVCTLLRQVPLTAMWGDAGNSMYAAAYDMFLIAWLVSAYGIPAVMSYLFKPRLKQGQYKNAGKVMQAVFLYASISGIVLGISLFFGSAFLVKVIFLEPLSELALQILAASLLFTAWNGVLRGFFLGNGAAFPVAASLLLEQLIILAAGFPLASAGEAYGRKVGALLKNESFSISFAAAGFAGGIFAGAALSFLFLLFLYLATHSYYKRKNGRDSGKRREGLLEVMAVFFTCLFPVLLFGFFSRGYLLCQQILFRQFMAESLGAAAISQQWGMYYGKYKIFTALPVVLAAAMGFPLTGKVRSLCRRADYQRMREQLQSMLQAVMILVIPFSVMIGILAPLILDAFLPGQDTETASLLLLTGFVTAVFFSAAYLLAEALWGMDRKITMLLCCASAFAIHTGALYVMLEILHFDIFGVLYADIIYAFCLLVFLGAMVQKLCRFRYGLLRSNVPLVIAAAGMGIVLFLCNKVLAEALPPGILLLVLAAAGIVIYFLLLLLLRGAKERELRLVPGGKWICMAARAVRLL